MRTPLSLTLAFCLASTPAWANQFCVNANVPSTAPTWNQNVALLRFDPTLGTLNSMTISIASTMTGSCGAEVLKSFPQQVNLMPSVTVSVRRPDNTVFVATASAMSFVDNLTAFDGTFDFGGTSGVMHSGLSVLSFTPAPGTPADLALFTGPAGNPGAIMLGVGAVNTSFATAPGNPVVFFTLQADATVTLCYDYTPQPNSYCFGDGTSAACPCGNASAVGAGAGCLHSFGIGARLAATGTASISNDTFLLTCTGLPATSSALFFQGTVKTNNGNGAVFGDGLRCVSGTVARLHVKTASGGVASYPGAGDAAVSVAGMVPANATRFYQVWYRNAVTFCTSSTFNLSQGVSMMWSP